jgi:alpha-beta hydrolase superfamily lysophospholipase
MSKRFEGHVPGFDQTELFFQTWAPEKVRGVMLITHGLGEHGESYHALAERLVEEGWQVYAWDLRGHGRSDGKRGFVRALTDFVKDLNQVFKMVTERHPNHNPLLFGHSLGGLVTLRFVETESPRHQALCLSSPAVGLTTVVPKAKQVVAKLANRWLPTLTLSNEIKHEDLTRDEAIRATFKTDNLRHDKVSPGLFLGMVEHFPLALAQAGRITGPVLMQLSGDDRIVDAEASRQLFGRLPNPKNKLLIYPDSLHEVFNDLDREQAISDLKGFINPYLGD